MAVLKSDKNPHTHTLVATECLKIHKAHRMWGHLGGEKGGGRRTGPQRGDSLSFHKEEDYNIPFNLQHNPEIDLKCFLKTFCIKSL